VRNAVDGIIFWHVFRDKLPTFRLLFQRRFAGLFFLLQHFKCISIYQKTFQIETDVITLAENSFITFKSFAQPVQVIV